MRRWSPALSSALLFALLGATPIDGGWQPPPGWTDVQNVAAPIVLLWHDAPSDGFMANINVIWDKLHDVDANLNASQDQLREGQVDARSEPVTCALGPGFRSEYEMQMFFKHLAFVAYLIPDGHGGTYVATYTRLSRTLPDPAAIAALKTICTAKPGDQEHTVAQLPPFPDAGAH